MLEFLIGLFCLFSLTFSILSFCVMVSVIITSERRFALSSKVTNKCSVIFYVLDSGTSAPR